MLGNRFCTFLQGHLYAKVEFAGRNALQDSTGMKFENLIPKEFNGMTIYSTPVFEPLTYC